MYRHLGPGIFILLGRPLGKGVDAAVDIRIFPLIEADHPVNHDTGFLRRGSIVEINQGLSIHLTAKDGELLPYCLDFTG